MKPARDLREHIAVSFNIVDELADMQLHINEELSTIILLNSLADEYENESRDKLRKLEALKIKMTEEFDARKDNKGQLVEDEMFVGQNKFQKKPECYSNSLDK
ncbi:hypothetical protein JTB14_019624 [Gonioctena quinquepunctata]|nr:hypothetical protein JTB14_019624 [Gonioctena quinquepunctata]